MNRRQFLVRTAALAAVPIVLQIVACGDDESTAPANQITFTGSLSGHTHSGIITCSQLNGGVDITVTTSSGGTPMHTHTFNISAAELAMIAQGNNLTIATNDIHRRPSAAAGTLRTVRAWTAYRGALLDPRVRSRAEAILRRAT